MHLDPVLTSTAQGPEIIKNCLCFTSDKKGFFSLSRLLAFLRKLRHRRDRAEIFACCSFQSLRTSVPLYLRFNFFFCCSENAINRPMTDDFSLPRRAQDQTFTEAFIIEPNTKPNAVCKRDTSSPTSLIVVSGPGELWCVSSTLSYLIMLNRRATHLHLFRVAF
jgi:hypothetical protein